MQSPFLLVPEGSGIFKTYTLILPGIKNLEKSVDKTPKQSYYNSGYKGKSAKLPFSKKIVTRKAGGNDVHSRTMNIQLYILNY